MNSLEVDILVVQKALLLGFDTFQGFQPHGDINYEKRILAHAEFIKRRDAEHNPIYKQPIGYVALLNPALKKIFFYRRARSEALCPDKRIVGNWSCGIGGHIEKKDAFGSDGNFFHTSIAREMRQELGINNIPLEILGYINDDNDAVGRVHFGILYAARIYLNMLVPVDKEIESGEFKTIEEIECVVAAGAVRVDGWTRIALEPLKKFLET